MFTTTESKIYFERCKVRCNTISVQSIIQQQSKDTNKTVVITASKRNE